MRKLIFIPVVLVLMAAICIPSAAQVVSANDDMYSEFMDPGREYRPRVWWHWMNGNVTRDGIRKDLEWMDRAGVAGFHNFDAGMSTPQVVDRRLVYMTPEWKDAFNYALDTADSLDMEVTVASSPGWSITGGPWVSDDDAEKRIVWREKVLHGGRRYCGPLPEPIISSGPYQDILGYPDEPHKFEYYRDLFVLAFPVSGQEALVATPAISTSDENFESIILIDNDLNTNLPLSPEDGGSAWIRFDYPEPQCVKSLKFIEVTGTPVCLEYSTDGVDFDTLVPELVASSFNVTTISEMSFPPVTAVSFRFRAVRPGTGLRVSEAALYPYTRVNCAYEKAGFWADYRISDKYPTPDTEDAVPVRNVIDITSRFRDGVLDWDVPEGDWRVMRFGYNLLGRRNGPASPEATGLEVDKLDAGAMRRYYDHYLGMYQNASGGRLGSAINCLMIDSYESGKATWTASMEKEFRSRRGYELRRWFPALAGYVLESAEKSEQFLFDWRKTLGELMAENHYDIVNDILDSYGMTRYTESHEERTAFVGDGMMVKRKADIPMSAIWARYNAGWHSSYPTAEADIRESSSVAHIYGQNVCAAESFTTNGRIGKWDGFGAYQCAPYNLKPLADAAMSMGLNRFVIHTSVHQPVDDRIPGLGLGTYGQWFNRHDTWAEEARPWTDYLTRSCLMLQKGVWAADIAYFYGEDKNVTGRFFDERIQIPRGYNYDFVNADILLNVLKIRRRGLETASGMRYRMLVIDGQVKYMSMPVLRRILRYARRGVAIYGPRPECKANLSGSDRRFRRITERIWDRGRSNVYSGMPLEEALVAAGIAVDVDLSAAGDADVRFVHRHLNGGELYWIANIDPEPRSFEVSLDVTGYRPEIWHADTGEREFPSYRMQDGRTYVSLDMVCDDSQFILLTEKTSDEAFSAPCTVENELFTIFGAWDIFFQQYRGAPDCVKFLTLKSLTESKDEGVRYFSGKATYVKRFYTPEVCLDGCLYLDLGEVHHMARVRLNGEDLGLVWKAPYRVDVSGKLRQGENRLEIEVINSWANRLIGDQRKRPEDRLTYTAVQFYTVEDEPIPSGLEGPVRVIKEDMK